MKPMVIILILFSVVTDGQTIQQNSDVEYKKKDLKKIAWIEGKWRGMFEGKPFYEMYQVMNDSTLKITSYEFNGKDTSKTSFDYVYWKNGAYYLGKQQNWKVTSITKKEIKMVPVNNASNEITWRKKNKKNWIAILTAKKGITTYNMEHFNPFIK
jgi:hypothetical protein